VIGNFIRKGSSWLMNARESEPFLPVNGVSVIAGAIKLSSTHLIEWLFSSGGYYNMCDGVYDGSKMSRARATIMGEVSLYQVLRRN